VFTARSRVRSDFSRLLERMRRRHYPETTQALALYWLKTIREKGYSRDEWEALNKMVLTEVYKHERGSAVDLALADLQRWTWAASELNRPRRPRRGTPPREKSDDVIPYAMRLLNEWAPVEISRLLIEEAEADDDDSENGIPAIAKARAIERILLRDRVSNECLEALLHPGTLSPRFFYPGDFEILQDVALYLLGRTEVPALPVLPAALLAVAPGTHLGSNYDHAVEEAFIVESPEGEELHVPIARARAMAALSEESVQFTSFVVTLDGRLWRTHEFQGGDRNLVTYQPSGRLLIDYSGDHACFHLPWYEQRHDWPGAFAVAPRVRMFGREWYGARWNQDSDGVTIDFVFARCLRANEVGLASEASMHRSHPASVDIAWSALETALTGENPAAAIEDLHREDLIPLARAIQALMESVENPRHLKLELIESRVRSVGYFGSTLARWYGPVRWQVLPAKVRSTLLWPRLYGTLGKSLHEVFEGVPEKNSGVLDSASWLRRLTRRSKAA